MESGETDLVLILHEYFFGLCKLENRVENYIQF